MFSWGTWTTHVAAHHLAAHQSKAERPLGRPFIDVVGQDKYVPVPRRAAQGPGNRQQCGCGQPAVHRREGILRPALSEAVAQHRQVGRDNLHRETERHRLLDALRFRRTALIVFVKGAPAPVPPGVRASRRRFASVRRPGGAQGRQDNRLARPGRPASARHPRRSGLHATAVVLRPGGGRHQRHHGPRGCQ